jgi:hypothetical protein
MPEKQRKTFSLQHFVLTTAFTHTAKCESKECNANVRNVTVAD